MAGHSYIDLRISLNTLIYDLLNIVRGAKVNSSEPITKKQVEFWIHHYRALLLKRDVDKGKQINVNCVQTIPAVELIAEDLNGFPNEVLLESGMNIYRTAVKIPKALDLNHDYGITYVGDLHGNQIQIVPENRINWQQYKTYTKNNLMCFVRDNYVYVKGASGLRYITIRGIFENPVEVNEMNNPLTHLHLATHDDIYPISADMIPALKELILSRELGIESIAPSDNVNDSRSEFTNNVV